MRKTMKRITAFVLAMAVLMTTVNWSFVSERTDAEMLDASSTNVNELGSTKGETESSVEDATEEVPIWTLTYQDDEVKVTVTGAEGVVPEGTILSVCPIRADQEETQEQYDEVAAQLQEKAQAESYDIIGFLAYDITLIDPDGNKIEPNDSVQVSMEYVKATLPEEVVSSEEAAPNVTVMHLEEDENGEVKDVVDLKRVNYDDEGILKINNIQDLQVNEEQAIEKAEFVTDSFSKYTVVWTTPDPDMELKVRIVINGFDLEDDRFVLDGGWRKEVEDSISAADIYAEVKEDAVLQGCKFLGMQLGMYDSNKQYDGPNGTKQSYVFAISYNAKKKNWFYSRWNGDGGWPTCDFTDCGGVPTISLVFETYLEVHVVDINGNPIALDLAPEQIADIDNGVNRMIDFYQWDGTNGIYLLKYPNATQADSGANTTGATIANAIVGNSNLKKEKYVYVGAKLDSYKKGDPATYTGAVSFNSVHNNRCWLDGGKGWAHWEPVTTNDSPYPKMYLVYVPAGNKVLHVKAIEAESGNELAAFDYALAAGDSIAASMLHTMLTNTGYSQYNENIAKNYTKIANEPGDKYVYGPVNNPTRIYNVAYDYTNDYWTYTTSSNANAANFQKWTTDAEATIYLIYDKNDELTEDGDLKTVETLNTRDLITLRLLDYSTYQQDILKGDPAYSTGQLAGGSNNAPDWNGNIKPGILQRVLGADGYPITGDSTNDKGSPGLSLKVLFQEYAYGTEYVNPTNEDKRVTSYNNLDGLFRKDIFEETGYYSYSSFENYAYFNGWSDFILYEAIGTPTDSTEAEKRYYYSRGNFMPFNSIEPGKIAVNTRNWYAGNGNLLQAGVDERYGETLYKTQPYSVDPEVSDKSVEEGNNYLFGMYMEADFYQPKGGLVEYPSKKDMEEMVYKFNGDDDLWIYVDNVLLLDIGGVHDAHDGQINFATGVISWSDCKTRETPITYYTTIVEQFWKAKKFPDGTDWKDVNDPNVNEFFKNVVYDATKGEFTQGTFADYTTHNMKMFYMERGKGASNLQMEFNLKLVDPKTLEVSKTLDNDTENRYDDVKFAFQLWAEDADPDNENEYLNTMSPIAWPEAYYKESGDQVPYTDSVSINGTTYQNVFYIKKGETIQFKEFPENREYQIVEIGLDSTKYQDALFNGDLHVTDSTGKIVGQASERAIAGDNSIVHITNTCITDDFELKKVMQGDQKSDEPFTFMVWVESMAGTTIGTLVPYVGNYYIGDTTYTTDNGKITIKAGETAVFKAFLIGTRFYVEEVNVDTKYQTPAKSGSTYTGSELGIIGATETQVKPDGAVENNADNNVTVTITNEYKPSVKVTKEWYGAISDHAPTEIHVALYKEGAAEQIGVATLNANNGWTYTWSWLETGTYVVKELKEDAAGTIEIAGKKYAPMNEGDTIVVNNVKYHVSYPTRVDTKDSVTNAPVSELTVKNAIVWQIFKTGLGKDYHEAAAPLEGAVFTLTGNGVTYIGTSRANDGIVVWTKDGQTVTYIPDGTYTLQESKAPTGYLLNTDKWQVKIENSAPTITGLNGATAPAGTLDGTTYELEFEYHNSPMYDLPSSGGNGIFWYIGAGIIVLLAATILVFKSRDKHSILEK